MSHELISLFGIEEKLSGKTAQGIYDQIEAKLGAPEFRPRTLFKRFNIEVMCTTDAATDTLAHHQTLRKSGWSGNVRPTFRPDAVTNLLTPGWKKNIETLSKVSGIPVSSYKRYIEALENRRAFFKKMGIDITVSATTIIMERIEEQVPTHPLTHLLDIEEKGLEIVEIKISPDSTAVGKAVRELSLPRKSKLSLIIRKEGKHRIPTSNTVIKAGDRIIALIPGTVEEPLRAALTTPRPTQNENS